MLWSAIDKQPNNRSFVEFLDNVRNSDGIPDYKAVSLRALELKPGLAVLDAGCGTGEDTATIAEILGDGGSAVGIDLSELMITEANNRAHLRWNRQAGNCLPKFEVQDICSLNFQSERFDRCRADRVLQHVVDYEKAVSELIRVTKSGGLIYLSDPDWHSLVIDSDSSEVENAVKQSICKGIPNPNFARMVPRLLKRFGIKEIRSEAFTFIIQSLKQADAIFGLRRAIDHSVQSDSISADTVNRWYEGLEQRERESCFFAAVTGFGVIGRK